MLKRVGTTGCVHCMSIPWLVSGHIQKLGLKVDKWKMELQKWNNGIGNGIEMKLRKTLANIGSIANVRLFKTTFGEYGVLITNNQNIAMNLTRRMCSYKW